MERKLATIQRIAEIKPIDGADAIEVVRVKDWWVVTKKGEYQPGDLCVYFEIDSFLPRREPFMFLLNGSTAKRMEIDGQPVEGIRLRTVRLRGQISQGLCMQIEELLPEKPEYYKEGDDVAAAIPVYKYEPAISAELAGIARGNFPSFIPKTDEERVQNLGAWIENRELMDQDWYITEKIDGMSATFYKDLEGNFGVCSRNLDLVESDSVHWKIARQYQMAEALPPGYAIQGEIYGLGIQKNPLSMIGVEFRAFSIYEIEGARYLDLDQMETMLHRLSIPMVPVLYRNRNLWTDGVDGVTVASIVSMADGPSYLNSEQQREGIVFRPHTAQFTSRGERVSFKAISNEYLIDHDA